jgi:uncharacterized protein
VEFDWDAANIDHIAEHGVTPAEVEEAVQDSRGSPSTWYLRNNEWRLNIIGLAGDLLLYVVITTRDPLVRVVSARVANRAERPRYPRSES